MSYRAVLVGCGKIGSEFADDPRASRRGLYTHAQAYAACGSVNLVAACDANPDRAARCAARWGLAAWYTDLGQMLQEQQPDIVSVCTPDDTHSDVLRAALLADGVRGVLTEKPLASTFEQAETLVALAQHRGVTLAVNYTRRYCGLHTDIREWVARGALGAVRLVRGLYTKGTIHNGSHWFDLVRYLLGGVTSVWASDRLREGGEDPTLDVRLGLDAGGVAELLAWPAGEFTIFEMDILGSLGRVRILDSGCLVEYHDTVEGEPFAGYRNLRATKRYEGGLRDATLRAVEDLVECVRTGTTPRCSGGDGIEALRIALAAQESARTGRFVQLKSG